MIIETEIPDTLSEWGLIAMKDEAKCHKSNRYVVDMFEWHRPYDSKCHVCWGGAVMAQTFKCDITQRIRPRDFTPDIEKKIQARTI